MDEKNIFNVIFHKFCYKPKPDGCAFQELGTGQLEILKNEKREKILKFTKQGEGELVITQFTYSKIIESEEMNIIIKCKDGSHLIISFENEEDTQLCCNLLSEISTKSLAIQVLRDAFDTNFVSNHFYDLFKDYLLGCVDNWAPNQAQGKLFAPIGILYQGSGHGKSRCMRTFSETYPSIYISLGRQSEHIYPPKSKIGDLLIESMSEIESANSFLFDLVNKALDLVIKIKANPEENDFISELNSYQYFHIDNVGNRVKNMQFFNSINNSQMANLDTLKMNQLILQKFNSGMKDQELFIFIDEANQLLEKSNYQESLKYLTKFQILRRSAQKLLKNVRIAIVVAGTDSKLCDFVSNKYVMSSSERINDLGDKLTIYEPFYKILFIDSMVQKDYYANLKSSLFQNLKERKAEQSLYFYGRPLWGSLLLQSNSNPDSVLELAERKLIFSCDWDSIEDKFLPSLALLSVRTTLSISYEVKYSSELISRYMSTVFYISEDNTNYAFRYFSEPILAQASRNIMIKDANFNNVIMKLNDYIQMMNFEAIGPIGEIAAQLILLKVFDHSDKVHLSETCTVKSFLEKLLGNTNFDVEKDILDGVVYFNHFIERLENLSYDEVLNHFVARGAAGKFKRFEKAFDLFIPIVLANNEITYMLIQVKNKEILTKNGAIKVFNEMKQADKSFFKNQNAQTHLSVVMSLGDEKDRNLTPKQNEIFYTLDHLEKCKIFSPDTRTTLKMLLNIGKFKIFSKKFDKDVLKCVMVGSV